jgi:hypothetical protein
MAADAGRRSYQGVLDAVWDEARRVRVRLGKLAAVSAAAFCKARQKLRQGLMQKLVTDVAAQTFSQAGDQGRWKGRRLFAIDGSKFPLRRSSGLETIYGFPTGCHLPQMLCMVLFDVLLRTPVDFLTAPYRASERLEFVALLKHLGSHALLLLDRGFEGFATFHLLMDRRIDFIIRCRNRKGFKAIEEFVRSGQRQGWVTLQRPHGCKSGPEQMRLRAVRCDLKGGRVEVLVTNLGAEVLSASEASDLYWKRWRVESYFRELKARWFNLQQFHSETASGVEQEFGAQVLFTAVAAALLVSASAVHNVPLEQICRKAALIQLHNSVSQLILRPNGPALLRELAALLALLARRRFKPRPGRSYPRISLVPSPKWGPKGKNWRCASTG